MVAMTTKTTTRPEDGDGPNQRPAACGHTCLCPSKPTTMVSYNKQASRDARTTPPARRSLLPGCWSFECSDRRLPFPFQYGCRLPPGWQDLLYGLNEAMPSVRD